MKKQTFEMDNLSLWCSIYYIGCLFYNSFFMMSALEHQVKSITTIFV